MAYLDLLPTELHEIINGYAKRLRTFDLIDTMSGILEQMELYEQEIKDYRKNYICYYVETTHPNETYNIYFDETNDEIFRNKYYNLIKYHVHEFFFCRKSDVFDYFGTDYLYNTLKTLSMKYKGWFIHPRLVRYFESKGIKIEFP